MRKFLLNNWPIVTLLALSVLIVWPLFLPGYFSHHDDLQVMRIFEMRKCFADWQIPCRWVPDMGYGNGYPLFNFYGVFAYYLGAVASFIVGFIGAAKLLFFLPLVLGGVGMYLLAKELFGKIPGFVGGVLYLFAPYRALDAYVRGAVGESFALALIPFVFYCFLMLIHSQKQKFFVLSTVVLFLFFITHNIMTLIFTPVILLWILLVLYQEKWQGIKLVIVGLILAFGMSAFFTLPAFFEKNLVQTEALTRAELDFRAQFVKVSQLFFDRSWNYSGSQPQAANTISYQIGWPHWWLAVLVPIGLVVGRKRKNLPLLGFLFLTFAVGVFMTHNKSAPVWESFEILAFVQFPWRFLSIAIFSASLLGAYFINLLGDRWLKIASIAVVAAAVFFNWQYFRPEHFYPEVTDATKLSGQNFVDQQKGALLDYLPKTALEPRELTPGQPKVISGDAKITNFFNRSSYWFFNIEASKESVVEIPVFDFPNWTTYVNEAVYDKFEIGKLYPHTHDNVAGRIQVAVPLTMHSVTGLFLDTSIRKYANYVSLISLVLLLVVSVLWKRLKIL